jgi:hypothetical protein
MSHAGRVLHESLGIAQAYGAGDPDESFNDAREEFGEQSLVEALRRNCELSSQALLTALVEEVRRFGPHEQHDDNILIVAKRRGNC